MAAEFQTHVDDMVKDADLTEVRDQFRTIRNLDIRGTIARAVDKDGTIREALRDPMRNPPPPSVMTPLPEAEVAARAEHTILPPGDAPAFVPPSYRAAAGCPGSAVAPAFVPPGAEPPTHA